MSVKRSESMKTIVNEDKGVVTVVIEDCDFDAVATICKRFDDSNVDNVGLMKKSYAGVAKCNPEDKFDRKTGCSLAAKRAMEKHKKAHTNAIKEWQVAMLKAVRNVCPSTFDSIIENKGYINKDTNK